MSAYTCRIRINNHSSISLTNEEAVATDGSYKRSPRKTLPAGDWDLVTLEDDAFLRGSEGYVKYATRPGFHIQMGFSCPMRGDNTLWTNNPIANGLSCYFYGTNKERTPESIPDGEWDQYPRDGHPLAAVFVITDAPK